MKENIIKTMHHGPVRPLVIAPAKAQVFGLRQKRGVRNGAPGQGHDLVNNIRRARAVDRVRIIDASGSPQEVTGRLLEAIADLLP